MIPYPMIAILISIEAYTTTTKQTNVFFSHSNNSKINGAQKRCFTSVGNLLDKHIDIVFWFTLGIIGSV